MGKLVYGVGMHTKGKYNAFTSGIRSKEYTLWVHVLMRCYSNQYHKKKPTYIDCEVSDNFKDFQFFAEWCNNQIGFNSKGYELDKDIVVKGNKLYSENNCFFVPKELNMFVSRCNSTRGDLPIGVYFYKKGGVYRAQVRSNGVRYLGSFSTPEEAFQAYKTCKEASAKQLAKEYEGLVHPKVIEALNNYVVEITD